MKHDYFSKKRSGFSSLESLPVTGKGRKPGVSSLKILMKITCIFVSALTIVSLFSVTQSSAQNTPFDDLTDGRRTGFFVGGGVEYDYTRFSVGGPDSYFIDDELASITGLSGGLRWMLGYAISENTAFYVTSFGTTLVSVLGIMTFIQEHPRYYFNGVIGFTNHTGLIVEVLGRDIESRFNSWNIFGFGLGYEFRPHFMLEFMLEYSLLTVSEDDYVYGDRGFNRARTELVVSFNYLFY